MRLINAPLNIEFSRVEGDSCEAQFKGEFDRLSENNDDPISAWLRALRAKGKVVDENEPILQLLIEIYRKIDNLHAQINNESKSYLALNSRAVLESIGHNVLVFSEDLLEIGAKYYARLEVAVFPIRKIPLFFNALDSKMGEICLMHSRDEMDFDSYIAARERSIIRENKPKG